MSSSRTHVGDQHGYRYTNLTDPGDNNNHNHHTPTTTTMGKPTTIFSLHSLVPTDTRPFTTSWILPPLFLALLRLLFFTYCLATQLTNWIYDGVHSLAYLIGQEFSYVSRAPPPRSAQQRFS